MDNREESVGLVLPNSTEAEISVLGAMLQDSGVVLRAVESLKPEDFYLAEHQEIYRTMMELSLEAIRLTETLLGKTNVNALSDLGVAALMLEGAVRGAWLNVRINLGSLKDQAAAEDYRRRGEELLNDTEVLTQAVYQRVLRAL